MTRRGSRSRLLLPILLLGPLLLAPAASAQSPTGRAANSSLISQARSALEAGDPALALSELSRLEAADPVAGQIIAEVRQGDTTQASRALSELLLVASPPPGAVRAGAIGAALGSVYRSPQLAALDRRTTTTPSVLSSIASYLEQLLAGLFHLGGALLWILTGLMVIAIGSAMVLVTLQRARTRVAAPDLTVRTQPTALGAARPDRLFAAADRFLETGQFREAVRLAFQGLLLSATSHRVLTVDPSWTNSELLRAARQVADLEPQLRPLVSQFNAVVYGGRDPGSEGCRQFNAACRAAAGAFGR